MRKISKWCTNKALRNWVMLEKSIYRVNPWNKFRRRQNQKNSKPKKFLVRFTPNLNSFGRTWHSIINSCKKKLSWFKIFTRFSLKTSKNCLSCFILKTKSTKLLQVFRTSLGMMLMLMLWTQRLARFSSLKLKQFGTSWLWWLKN